MAPQLEDDLIANRPSTATRRSAMTALIVVLLLVGIVALPSAALDGGVSPEATATEPTTTAAAAASATEATATAGDPSSNARGGGSVNNEVVVVNTTDGRFAHRVGSGTARVTGGDVANTNSAAAVASCVECRTVAVAVQIVLVMGESSSIAPRNQAVAINNNCLRCDTAAFAYQYVVTTGGIVRFTADGQQRLAALEAQIRDLGASDLSFFELQTRLDQVVAEMWSVVDNEIVRVGLNPRGTAYEDAEHAETDGPASPTPTPSATESFGSTPTESPMASETTEPSPSETSSSSPGTSPEPTTSPSQEPSPSASP